MKLFVK